MTPEKQRIAIAEACGWKGISEQFLVGYAPWRTEPYSDRVNACPVDELECFPLDPLPDYLNDLNEMRKVEEMLLPDDAAYSQRFFYASELGRITGNDNGNGWKPLSNDACFPILHATAAQRAEAFLKTLELWAEE
jgi:hypothetical protein